MTKSATDLMQEIIFAALIDSIEALKASSRGMPNTLLRELNSIHANSTFADLPKEIQAAIGASVRGAFNRLLKEGYTVSQAGAAPPRAPPRGGPDGGPRPGPRSGPPRRGPGSGDARRPPRNPGAPAKKPRPPR